MNELLSEQVSEW